MTDLALGWAFSAGAVATVNPCGFAMLPSFVAYYVGADDALEGQSVLRRALRGAAVGGLVTVGFLVVFALMGVGLGIGARAVLRYLPWASAAIGVIMVLLGLWLLAGRVGPHLPLPHLRATAGTGPRAMVAFGVTYAVASLSCTLPIFLVVVGTALAAAGPLGGLLLFVTYGLGMGAVLIAISLGATLFKGAVARGLRPLLPHVERLSALMLTAAGAYLVYYQISLGALR